LSDAFHFRDCQFTVDYLVPKGHKTDLFASDSAAENGIIDMDSIPELTELEDQMVIFGFRDPILRGTCVHSASSL
jgi:hypothetical protein